MWISEENTVAISLNLIRHTFIFLEYKASGTTDSDSSVTDSDQTNIILA